MPAAVAAVPALHQFVPTLDPGAVGAHLLEIQRRLRDAGWDSEVFSEHTKAPYDGRAHRFRTYGTAVPARDSDVLVYHSAIGSSVADWLMDRRPPRLVVHGNLKTLTAAKGGTGNDAASKPRSRIGGPNA